MRFWDTSALVSLFISAAASERAEELFRSDAQITVGVLTRVELLSSLTHRLRESAVDRASLERARSEIFASSARWAQVADVSALRESAEAIVEKHPLRAGDALQLAAAIVASDGDAASLDFVTFDNRLGEAARREGFRVLGTRR